MNRARRAAMLAALVLVAAPLSAAHAVGARGLTGVVTLEGRPVSGATVTLTVLPAPGTFTDEPYRAVPAASGKTGVDGRFLIPLPTVDAQLPALNGGTVNYWVQAFYNSVRTGADPSEVVWGGEGTAYSAATLAYSTVEDAGVTDPVDDLAAEVLLSAPDPVTLELTTYETGDQVVMTGTDTIGGIPGSHAGDGGQPSECRSHYGPYVTIVDAEIQYQPVGEVHVGRDSSAKFEYGEHANTDLNGAYSMNGGPWSVSTATSHMDNKNTMMTVSYNPGEELVVRTGFRYRKERLDFTDDGGDGHVCRSDYRVIPEGWKGGVVDGENVHYDNAEDLKTATSKAWAVQFNRGSTYEKKTARGTKYTFDVKAFGISLSAQSTWSKEVDIRWTFGSTGEHWLYGSNNTPDAATNVYAW